MPRKFIIGRSECCVCLVEGRASYTHCGHPLCINCCEKIDLYGNKKCPMCRRRLRGFLVQKLMKPETIEANREKNRERMRLKRLNQEFREKEKAKRQLRKNEKLLGCGGNLPCAYKS